MAPSKKVKLLNIVFQRVVNIYAGSTITIDGSSSYDAENDLINSKWFRNNQPVNDDNSIITHKFHYPGKYNVKLEITDNSGFVNHYSIANKTITVHPIPSISLTDYFWTCVGDRLEIKPILTSTMDTKVEWFVNGYSIANGQIFNYVFKENGKYVVVAKLIDETTGDKILDSDTSLVEVISLPQIGYFEDRTEYIGAAYDYILFDAGNIIIGF